MSPIFLGCKNGRKAEPVTEEENTGKGADLWENESSVLDMVRFPFLWDFPSGDDE